MELSIFEKMQLWKLHVNNAGIIAFQLELDFFFKDIFYVFIENFMRLILQVNCQLIQHYPVNEDSRFLMSRLSGGFADVIFIFNHYWPSFLHVPASHTTSPSVL